MDRGQGEAAGSDGGAALQAAWLGSLAASHRPMASSRRHLTITSCMAEVRRVLYAAGRPLQLRELTQETGHDGMAIGAVLVKLQAKSLVCKTPPPAGKINGAGYLWISSVEPEARNMA